MALYCRFSLLERTGPMISIRFLADFLGFRERILAFMQIRGAEYSEVDSGRASSVAVGPKRIAIEARRHSRHLGVARIGRGTSALIKRNQYALNLLTTEDLSGERSNDLAS